MATKFDAAAYNFRKKCPYISKDLLRWFPGHMNKGLKQMQRKLTSVDCVIEVHDARIPFTGRNPIFTKTVTGAKPHILVLNKMDLTMKSLIPKIKDQLKAEQNIEHVVYTNSKDQHCLGLKMLRPLMVDLIKNSNRYNRTEESDYNVMIIGVPNVGKSSLINMMRSKNMSVRHALPVGAVAGVTRSLMTKMRINNDPTIFMLDTPGILEPSVTDIEAGLKLALCASLQDHLVGEEAIADYLLYWLNKHGKFKYVDYMGLLEPCDDIHQVLFSGARKMNRVRRVRDFDGSTRDVPDLTEVARTMIKAFRTGELGRVLLDVDLLKNHPSHASRSTRQMA
ncbi:mitochondrial GTPase 1 [Ostrinia furnacalis]|uniref:mitochondrial GTPase 1 n=1 Tax=Ostrinia furnacalis TaxID=93504 RepID=UPI00103EC2B8|nr:mitochondrial GTPase 1 [Ostrinia furnacalis]XP_028160842.1 mitochondrial GTPase 1 [Ostrinia furnacalis]